MSITRGTIKRLERKMDQFDSGELVIPLMATPEEAEAVRQEAKRLGKKTIGIPLEDAPKRK